MYLKQQSKHRRFKQSLSTKTIMSCETTEEDEPTNRCEFYIDTKMRDRTKFNLQRRA